MVEYLLAVFQTTRLVNRGEVIWQHFLLKFGLCETPKLMLLPKSDADSLHQKITRYLMCEKLSKASEFGQCVATASHDACSSLKEKPFSF